MSKELIRDVGESLIRLRLLIGTQFMKPIKEIEREKCELPPGYIHIMRWMMSNGNEPVSMKDLANSSNISKPNLTTMVDRLYSDGLVERSADQNDRRIVNVALTKEGIELLRRHKAEIMKFVEIRLSLLEDDELIKLKGALEDIGDIVQLMGERLGDAEHI